MDHIEALAKPHEILEGALRAGAPPALQVRDVGRPPDHAEGDRVPAELHGALGIARHQLEDTGRPADRVQHQAALEAHPLVGLVHMGARRAEEAPALVVQHP